MELRSRKTIGQSSAPGGKGKDKNDESREDDDTQLGDDGSVDAIYIPSSEDDFPLSSDSDETYEEQELVKSKQRLKSKASDIGWGDDDGSLASAERETMGSGEQVNNEQVPIRFAPVNYITSSYRRRKGRGKKKKAGDPPLLWEVWEEETERWIDKHMDDDIDLDGQNGPIVEAADEPPGLRGTLLRYQKEWLAWALKQENSEIKGGILADEMGMGKTIQAIALVLAKRCQTVSEHPAGSSTSLPGIRCTLVICPLAAVTQWVSEIDRFTLKGSMKVLVYHGSNRERNSKQFNEFDFVITTYSTIEADYRKFMMPPKLKCVYCGKAFQKNKLAIHLRYFCGPHAIRTVKQSKQEKKKRKVTKNSSNLDKDGYNWFDDPTGMSYGQETSSEASSSMGGAKSGKSVLHSVKWDRIILDEAHCIKDRRSNTAKAVLSLESSFKWALSGTPLQNRVGELYSLVRFLQIIPYSYYLCKDCDCRVLDYSTTDCPNCPHKSVRHFCWWNRYVATPIQMRGNSYEGKRSMILLKQKVLKNIVLRRTKKGRAADLALPPRIVSLRQDSLDITEADLYFSLYTDSQAQFNTYIEAGTVMNNYAHIFDLLTRLRQAVDHPYLVVYSKTASALRGEMEVGTGDVQQLCGVCGDSADDPVVTNCAHTFCKACLFDSSASEYKTTCPTCSVPLTVDFTNNESAGDLSSKTTIKGFRSSSILNRIKLDDFQTSTKIEALREEIRFMVERDGSAKGIVFSQFTSFLDLINYSLQKSGISCVQLVGSMSITARDAAIKKFTDDPECKIFLISLKAGGVALNLTVASHVFLMDPWWNPAVEQQAQDRIHRIGQYKPIRIVRFVIENTVEERILQLQEKKQLVFEGTVGGSSDALGKLTEADLRFLFLT